MSKMWPTGLFENGTYLTHPSLYREREIEQIMQNNTEHSPNQPYGKWDWYKISFVIGPEHTLFMKTTGIFNRALSLEVTNYPSVIVMRPILVLVSSLDQHYRGHTICVDSSTLNKVVLRVGVSSIIHFTFPIGKLQQMTTSENS